MAWLCSRAVCRLRSARPWHGAAAAAAAASQPSPQPRPWPAPAPQEAALSQRPLLADGGLLRLRRLDLRKMLGVWKASSTRWLRDLVAALEERHLAGRGSPGSCPLVLWDEGEAQGGA